MNDSRQCSPASMVSVKDLLEKLLVSTGVGAVHGNRLEQAIERALAAHPELLDSPDANYAHKLCNHIMAHMTMLRNLLVEDMSGGGGGGVRAYAKTGGSEGRRARKTGVLWAMS